VLVLGGVAFAFVARKPDTAGRAARRQQLLDALVAMDKAGSKNEKRREELLVELESLWDD
jgi:signal recognition particle GTPase